MEEQLSFLENRQIHSAASLTQETLHSIHTQKIEAAVMKIELSKAYDRVSWTFVRLCLLQISFNLNIVNLIMGCIQSVPFIILINGALSSFFRKSY